MINEFNLMVDKFKAGRAILFTGAGFSSKSINILNDDELPLAEGLANKISELGKFEKSNNLFYAADRYIRESANNDEKYNDLVNLLKQTFTIQSPSDAVKKICSAPWHKFYTTNYDNSIEISIDNIISIDPDSPVNKNEIKDKRCVHINGYIENLTKNNLNKSFKLSEASYLSPDGFLSSPWFTVFKRDLERCSMLVFVGYSLYDLDIKRILFEIPGLKEKTFFIVREGCSEENKYTYSQYGTVLDIGADNFGNLIEACDSLKIQPVEEDSFSIKKYEFEDVTHTVHDKDIEQLLLLGKVNKALIENDAVTQKSEFVVFRNAIDDVVNFISTGNVIITGDLGNGKSIFANECLPVLAARYGNVYLIDDPYIDYILEVEELCKQGDGIKIFVIENYFLYTDLLEYLSVFDTTNVRFLLTSRSGKHERLKDQLNSINFSYKELSIDILTEREETLTSKLIDSVGFWGKKFTTNVEKKEFIERQCRGQFASLLLGLLDSIVIKDKLTAILGNLIEQENNLKKATVTGLFICMHDIKADLSLLSTLAGNYIYDKSVLNNENFREIFHSRKGNFESVSSIFCQKIIKDFISPEYVIELLIDISRKLQLIKSKSKIEESIFKSCFKFSTVERILPSKDKLKNIIDYYEKLKRAIPWLIDDPHFWVQYAMGYISCNEYIKAQQLIDNAYGKARNRPNYHTNNIDTQQARLHFLAAIKYENVSDAIELFLKGHQKLSNVPNDIYKFRQIYLYEDFCHTFYTDLTDEMKISIKRCCNNLLGKLLIKEKNSMGKNDFLKQKAIDQLKNIISQIESGNSFFTKNV